MENNKKEEGALERVAGGIGSGIADLLRGAGRVVDSLAYNGLEKNLEMLKAKSGFRELYHERGGDYRQFFKDKKEYNQVTEFLDNSLAQEEKTLRKHRYSATAGCVFLGEKQTDGTYKDIKIISGEKVQDAMHHINNNLNEIKNTSFSASRRSLSSSSNRSLSKGSQNGKQEEIRSPINKKPSSSTASPKNNSTKETTGSIVDGILSEKNRVVNKGSNRSGRGK